MYLKWCTMSSSCVHQWLHFVEFISDFYYNAIVECALSRNKFSNLISLRVLRDLLKTFLVLPSLRTIFQLLLHKKKHFVAKESNKNYQIKTCYHDIVMMMMIIVCTIRYCLTFSLVFRLFLHFASAVEIFNFSSLHATRSDTK